MLARAQKLKVELEEKVFEVEAAVQDNLTEIAMATAELENAKRSLIPSAPAANPGSACITFSRKQIAELYGFLLACRKAWPVIPKEGTEQNGCAEGHDAAGVTQEAVHEEVDAARKLAKLVGWVGEKLAAPNPPSPGPATPPVHPESLDATVKDATLPEPTFLWGRGQRQQQGVASSQAPA